MPCSPAPDRPTFADVKDAALRLRGHAVRTPLVESARLNEHLGGRLLIKAEMLQRTGAFKFRGAYNRVSRIDEPARPRSVVAYSSGNHAQGVAAAAALFGIPALIVMPEDAPAAKIAGTRAYGAEVVFYDRARESREELAEGLAAERGATLVRPYDDPYIIAGQGTVGLELAAQAREMDAPLDAVLVPCGGGGLIAGCALALAEESPEHRNLCRRARGVRRHGTVSGRRQAPSRRRRRPVVLRRPSAADPGRVDVCHQYPAFSPAAWRSATTWWPGPWRRRSPISSWSRSPAARWRWRRA